MTTYRIEMQKQTYQVVIHVRATCEYDAQEPAREDMEDFAVVDIVEIMPNARRYVVSSVLKEQNGY